MKDCRHCCIIIDKLIHSGSLDIDRHPRIESINELLLRPIDFATIKNQFAIFILALEFILGF